MTIGETCLLFPVGDVTSLVEGIRLPAHSSTLRIEVGNATRQSVAFEDVLLRHATPGEVRS